MAKVYVKWYGKVLEGEMLDGDYLGMKQVVIPLDGHHPIAMFTPEHVYQSPEQIGKEVYSYPESYPTPETIITKDPSTKLTDIISYNNTIETFKRENWDKERNHLRIDKLDDFYQLWRMVMKSDDFVEAEAPKRIVSDERMEELKQQLKKALAPKPVPQPTPKPETPKPSKKMLRSTGIQQFNDRTQLALFE